MYPSPTTPRSIHPRWFLLAGWLVFFVLWTLFILGWGQGQVTLEGAATSGLITTVTGALLGYGVWRFSGRVHWPDPLRWWFLAIHFLAAVLFSVLWTAAAPFIGVLMEGGSLSDIEWTHQTYTWRLFMGIWLYFIVAGASYAARINRSLRDQRELAVKAEALAAQANLDAMRSQLRPHFLFNALHSVSSMIETDPAKAADGMEMLGDLLRYTIRERENNRVTLAEEWRFVSDYADLQRIRFGDRIQISDDLAPGTGSVDVPPFVVQPLVENAFIHGFGETSQTGTIRYAAGFSGDKRELEITVTDDGPGPSTERGHGSGLANLEKRLKSIFGESASVSLTRSEGHTQASVRIPIQTADEDSA